METLKLKRDFESAEVLVLCKKELFLQTETGDTIRSVYPVDKELALLLGEVFTKEVLFE